MSSSSSDTSTTLSLRAVVFLPEAGVAGVRGSTVGDWLRDGDTSKETVLLRLVGV